MNREAWLDLFAAVERHEIKPEEAMKRVALAPFEELKEAVVDHHRSLRQGVPEVIWGQSKTAEQIESILDSMIGQKETDILITRLEQACWQRLAEKFTMDYHPAAKLAVVSPRTDRPSEGNIVIATGGTSDVPVAEEAAVTAEVLGNRVTRMYDVGISGLHRLLSKLPVLIEARVIIAIAGMEGALPSVIGGLVSCPVIAVPTSVGYGASQNGMAALLAMLNSCASGVGVVNIDNGFGAAFLASRINQLPEKMYK